jgi:L-2-hydroxyglutarate oxidase LhgO
MRYVVVGGGILGLATARRLRMLHPDAEIVVLEKEPRLAAHQSSHNSGVVHQGLYYTPGSLKARLCRRGADLLQAFCREHSVPYEAFGKVVVATDTSELPRLDELERRAQANSVPDLRRLDASELAEIEPHVRGIAALHSPHTAVVDYAAVANALAAELQAGGVSVRTGTAVARVAPGGAPAVILHDGTRLAADAVVVCAGLHADRLAIASGEPAEPRIVPFRGEYWQLRGAPAELVRGLIYPVPDPALPFLGVHLTRKLDGSVWIGPNAVPALAREGYRRRDINGRDLLQTLTWPGTWRMLSRHWRAAVTELGHSASKRRFVAAAQRYVPDLSPAAVVSAPAGVRAQALDRDGALVDDFRLGAGGGVVWVRNAPSPAATSSLAIAEELVTHALSPAT